MQLGCRLPVVIFDVFFSTGDPIYVISCEIHFKCVSLKILILMISSEENTSSPNYVIFIF
jgi:hypothetical protein